MWGPYKYVVGGAGITLFLVSQLQNIMVRRAYLNFTFRSSSRVVERCAETLFRLAAFACAVLVHSSPVYLPPRLISFPRSRSYCTRLPITTASL